MAGSSDKKNKKKLDSTIKFYQLAFISVTFFYLILQLLRGELFEFWTFIYLCFFSTVSYITYGQIHKGLEYGLSSESYGTSIDIFVLNQFVQITTCFYSYFWYIYLLIPGILAWKILGWCWGKATNIEYKEDETQDKKGLKKKKNEEKVVYKKVK